MSAPVVHQCGSCARPLTVDSPPCDCRKKVKLTLAQRGFLDRIAAGYGNTGNTNPTGTALEKRGLCVFRYSVSFCGRWEMTDEGRAVYDALRGDRARLVA